VRTRFRLPRSVKNPLSTVGAAIATAMAALFVALFVLQLLGYLTNPYIGLLVFVAVPIVFVGGLLLIPLGAAREARRLRRQPDAAPAWPVIDLRQPLHRHVFVAVLVLTFVNLVILSMAAYGGVHYMETTSFCGQVCHTTMQPQFVAHQAWPHARVACTQCHVGPGAEAFVAAKAAGTRQLLQVLTNNVPKPVPPPRELIQPALTTCGQCHSGLAHDRDEVRVVRDYGDDEANSETQTTLRMHVGGRSGGIHRHLALAIEFPAREADQDSIRYVRVRYPGGMEREFRSGNHGGEVGERRRMDCLDCHNRPAHTFSYTPQRAVDRAIAAGQIPRELPFVRREAVAAVNRPHADSAAALEAIATSLREFYASRPDTDSRIVQRAIAGVQDVWVQNVFPAMNVTWRTYRNNLGHVDTPGCFRCHDDNHKAADGAVIKQDCELCHTIE
jgi:NapC/NirT cytochrome c family, N-terminal region